MSGVTLDRGPTVPADSGSETPGGFGLYVHWPFCRSKCPYCDFNSHVRAAIDEPRWRRALLAELDHYAAETPGRRLDSIFFGGGTPSLMQPDTTAALIARAKQHWRFARAIEITLEANPTSVEAERFAGFAEAGVNRVSLGLQALEDTALRFLGRQHSAAEARAALAIARRRFSRVSFDLIYARPGQSVAAWMAELEAALGLAGDHLSIYQLTIEPGTAFEGAVARGDFQVPDERMQADLYEATQARLDAAGMPAYEISNHARPGEACRHNLVYWRYGDYVGVGPGAHGRLTLAGGAKLATRQHRAPEAWLAGVEAEGHATRQRDAVAPDARLAEMLMMGLRLEEGVAIARIEAESGRGFAAAVPADRLERMAAGGFVAVRDGRILATKKGRQRLDAVLAALIA